MGFFTDSYDLNVISTALLLVKPEYRLSAGQVGLIGSTSLIASFIGALVFGRIGDLIGRKRVYGIEAAIMVVGAVLTALAPNFTWLLITRFVLGIGIGGDDPISATIMTEYANRRSRGKQVAMMFSSYTLGQVAAFVVALTLLAAGVNHDLAWRLMLGLGALPALGVLYSRRRMPESPRFTASVEGDRQRAADDLNSLVPGAVSGGAAGAAVVGRSTLRGPFTSRRLLITLLGTAGTWFAYDVAVYGNSISQPAIVDGIVANPSPVEVTAVNLILAVSCHRAVLRHLPDGPDTTQGTTDRRAGGVGAGGVGAGAAVHRAHPRNRHEPGDVRRRVRPCFLRLDLRPQLLE
ncbi:MAG TPA: MFS transporter [Amycolatopsis sp.]|nr:MFS transporter [Amycolatopsis sp.]